MLAVHRSSVSLHGPRILNSGDHTERCVARWGGARVCLSFEPSVKPIRTAGLDTPFCPAPFLRAALGSRHAHVRVPACSLSCLPPTLLRLCGSHGGPYPPGLGQAPCSSFLCWAKPAFCWKTTLPPGHGHVLCPYTFLFWMCLLDACLHLQNIEISIKYTE